MAHSDPENRRRRWFALAGPFLGRVSLTCSLLSIAVCKLPHISGAYAGAVLTALAFASGYFGVLRGGVISGSLGYLLAYFSLCGILGNAVRH